MIIVAVQRLRKTQVYAQRETKEKMKEEKGNGRERRRCALY
jgi:hypothetical protein